MVKYEDITIKVGFWRGDGVSQVEQIKFRGRLLASGTEFYGIENEEDMGIDWEIYQTEEGLYIVYWFQWSVFYEDVDTADYAILDTLPDYNQELEGIIWGPYLNPIPDNVIDEAKVALFTHDQEA